MPLRFAFAILAALICAAPAAATGVLDQVAARGTLRVGVALSAPGAMRDRDGALIGFEIDVAGRLATDLGVRAVFVVTEFDDLIATLRAGDVDVVISGLSITMPRSLQVNFSIPYANSSMGVLANRGRAGGLSWPVDYNAPEVVFACRDGAAACAHIAQRFAAARLVRYPDQAAALAAVLDGRATAMIANQPAPAFAAFDNPDAAFTPTDEKITPGNEGFAVRKGAHDALNVFNNWILLNWTSGWLERRYRYWFGGRPWADRVAR